MPQDYLQLRSFEKKDPRNFLDNIDFIRTETQKRLAKDIQAEMGQFLTSPSTACMMASMYNEFPNEINLLDPGAGVGTLSAAFISNVVQNKTKPQNIKITAFEIDPTFINGLETTLIKCKKLCNENNIRLDFNIKQEDFITSSVDVLLGQNSLFADAQPEYNFAILNPPYRKINSSSKARHLLNAVGIETTNLYSAFVWLVMKLLKPEGEMVAIVPRSFCNGPYFKPFRSELVKTMTINRIHLFESRDKAFSDGDVLQENIILHAIKTKGIGTDIEISLSDNPEDPDMIRRVIKFNQLIHPDDPDMFIRIIPDKLGHQIDTQINGFNTTLEDLGIKVSTGRVVAFRSKDHLRYDPDDEVIPLIHPGNIKNGTIVWPQLNNKKPSYLAATHDVNNLVVPSQYYVLVKRFSSKEEKRRIYAALYDPIKIPSQRVGIENHVNFYHRRYGEISEILAKGIVLYLNSSLVDQFFRQFSGHTQVNATDLRNLKYPSEAQLITLGKRVNDEFPDQDNIDKIISEEVALNKTNGEHEMLDPILAKKKIKEALSILQMLTVPRAQQNDRSALTLLALANIKAETEWNNATENLIGISEMMDYFKENYGIDYAPNTRETVRRQTVHQFIQLGLVIENPDNRSRPINSPKTRYIIEPKALELIRKYGSPYWLGGLKDYLKEAKQLGTLQFRERAMQMIPVTLPNGESILLTSGGQNSLIKQIIEEFCPRFTPGAKIIYIGDAGTKLNINEIKMFEDMGLKIDKHGKMPDVIVEIPEKNWLILIEAVTSHGPINIKRHNELKDLFGGGKYDLVYVTAFETRKAMLKYLSEIAWETEVWVSEAPSHLIHFDGERFLGPYID